MREGWRSPQIGGPMVAGSGKTRDACIVLHICAMGNSCTEA